MSDQERVIELLEELVRWTKISSIPKVKSTLIDMLSTTEERIAYQQSDGKTSTVVSKLANVSNRTVFRWWKKWVKAGIAEAVPARGGKITVRSFSLEELGIELEVSKEQTKPEAGE
jgi:transposase